MGVRKNSRKVTIKLCLEGEVVFQEEKRCVGHSRQREHIERHRGVVKKKELARAGSGR